MVAGADGNGPSQVPALRVEDGPVASARFVWHPSLPPRQNPGGPGPPFPAKPPIAGAVPDSRRAGVPQDWSFLGYRGCGTNLALRGAGLTSGLAKR